MSFLLSFDKSASYLGVAFFTYIRDKSALVLNTNLSCRGNDIEKVALQKVNLQARFLEEFGVKLWKPKPGGGTFMDGRCAKLAFGNPENFSDLIGKLSKKRN